MSTDDKPSQLSPTEEANQRAQELGAQPVIQQPLPQQQHANEVRRTLPSGYLQSTVAGASRMQGAMQVRGQGQRQKAGFAESPSPR